MKTTRAEAVLAQSPEAPGVDWSRYEFIDLGCSTGGSVRHCQKRFAAKRGLGLDTDPQKIEKARSQGFEALCLDPLDLDATDVVRFVSMMQFLEHLPDFEAAERVLRKAVELATDFLYIHHPSFEDEHYLASEGLRLYYHHWSGHPSHLLCADLFAMFERLGALRYLVRPLKPIHDSSHPAIIPSGTPKNQQEYDPVRHGPKPEVTFPRPVYRHIEFFVALRPLPDDEWRRIVFG